MKKEKWSQEIKDSNPAWLINLVEAINEGLHETDRIEFQRRILAAIPTDTDLSSVRHKIAIKRLEPLAYDNPSVSDVISTVINLHREESDDEDAWEEAEKAATSAVRDAVYASEEAAAWSAARSVSSEKWSAASSAEWSAAAARWSAAAAAAWGEDAAEEAWSIEAENLIEELTI